MSSEPPETTHEHDQRPAGETEDPSSDRSRAKQRTIAAIVAALIVAGGVAAFLFVSDPETPVEQQPTTPAERLACPNLLRAAEAFEQGDQAEVDREIDLAAEVAEKTLQTSGQAFGETERIALELDLGAVDRTQTLLARAKEACS